MTETTLTRRPVSEGGERHLLQDHRIENHGTVTLVDYMGSDEAIARIATAGHDRTIFPENPSRQELLNHCDQHRIYEPFKFAQLKIFVQAPIAVALHPVVYAQQEVLMNILADIQSCLIQRTYPLLTKFSED
jgi:hypothetical protein